MHDAQMGKVGGSGGPCGRSWGSAKGFQVQPSTSEAKAIALLLSVQSLLTQTLLFLALRGIVAVRLDESRPLALGSCFSMPSQQPEADFCSANPLDGFIYFSMMGCVSCTAERASEKGNEATGRGGCLEHL